MQPRLNLWMASQGCGKIKYTQRGANYPHLFVDQKTSRISNSNGTEHMIRDLSTVYSANHILVISRIQ